MDDLDTQFDELNAQVVPAQRKCNSTYIAWQNACAEWEELSRKRNEVWGKIVDGITTPKGTGS